MKVLFIGGTGNISTACSRLAIDKGHEVYMLNRGISNRPDLQGAKSIRCDIKKPAEVKAALKGLEFVDHYPFRRFCKRFCRVVGASAGNWSQFSYHFR